MKTPMEHHELLFYGENQNAVKLYRLLSNAGYVCRLSVSLTLGSRVEVFLFKSTAERLQYDKWKTATDPEIALRMMYPPLQTR